MSSSRLENDIAALRAIPMTREIFVELWAWGPDQRWYRYLVLSGLVEILEDDDIPDNDGQEGGQFSRSPCMQNTFFKSRAGVPLQSVLYG